MLYPPTAGPMKQLVLLLMMLLMMKMLLPRLPPAGSGAVLQTVLSYLPAAGPLEQLEGLSPLHLRLQYSAMCASGYLWGMARQLVRGWV